jgi:hypothetical protein
MTRLTIIGHGGFDTTSEMYLVPPNTTIRFFSDAGSNLMLPAVWTGPGDRQKDPWTEGKNCRFDYEKVASALDMYKETEKPLEGGAVVYNMMLDPAGEATRKVAQELHDKGKWGGDLLMHPGGGTWKLCNGDASKCPTPKLNVAESRHDELASKGSVALTAFQRWLDDGATGELPEEIADFKARLADVPAEYLPYVATGVPAERWKHGCDGILGKNCGEGKDIFWVACSGFAVNQDDLDAIGLSEGLPKEMSATTDGPSLQWVPNDAALTRISELNAEKLKDTPAGQTVKVVVGGLLMLIGDGHEGDALTYVRRQGDISEGVITVTKAGAFSKGTLQFSGIKPGQQGLVEKSVKLFSEKKVTFA